MRQQYVLYLRMAPLLQSLRDTWKGDAQISALHDHYCSVPILFIDDMSDSSQDNVPLPAYQQNYAVAIMGARMGDMRPTIVTSNWDANHLPRLGQGLCRGDVGGLVLYSHNS